MADESLPEKLEAVHEHLDVVDEQLNEVAQELEETIEAAMDEAGVEVTYSVDNASFEAHLPLDEITSQLNEQLEFPYFVTVVDNQIQIRDFSEEAEKPIFSDKTSQRDRIKNLLDLIEQLDARHERGVPIEEIVAAASHFGMDRSEAECEVKQLKQKGEVYEPDTDRLRVT